jgi:Ca2+-binding RTX toxin-like protein
MVDVTLTSGDDVYTGTSGDDTILGKAGNDIIDGAQGDDFINGGNGDDTINAGAGDDRAGRDAFAGGVTYAFMAEPSANAIRRREAVNRAPREAYRMNLLN